MSSVYRIGEFAERIGRSASTVRRWEAEGRITVRRSPSGQRFYTDVHAVLTPGLPVDEWVSEIGGGMNLTRPKLLTLMSQVKAGQVATLVIAHQDRLARFGYDYLEHEAKTAGCDIVVANQEALSPQQEMVQDLLAIVHAFSCRLSGLRRYEKTLKADDLTGGAP